MIRVTQEYCARGEGGGAGHSVTTQHKTQNSSDTKKDTIKE